MKHFLMLQLYRVQHAGNLLSPFMWAFALAGIWWPIIAPLMVRYGWPESWVALGTALLFFLFLIGIGLLGYLYDSILRLWVESHHVSEERNPYADRALTPKERSIIEHTTIPIMERFAREDHRIAGHVEFMREWIREKP